MTLSLFDPASLKAEGSAAVDRHRASRIELLYENGTIPRTNWKAPNVKDLPTWRDAKMTAVDVETRDPDIFALGCGARRPGCYITGVSFALEDGPAYYLPVAHAGGGNLDPEHVFSYFRDQVKNYTGEIAAADATYDADWLKNHDVDLTKFRIRDPLTGAALINEHDGSYRYEDVLRRNGFKGKDETVLQKVGAALGLDPKTDMWQFPAEAVGGYGEGDVRDLIPLVRKQEAELRRQELWRAWDLESDLVGVLVDMRRHGIAVDEQALHDVEQWATKGMEERFARFYLATGIKVGREMLNSGWKLEEVCTRLGLPALPRTDPSDKHPGGQPKSDEDTFDAITHPAFSPLVQAKKLDKLKTTYIAQTHRYLVNGRVHPTIKSVRGTRDNQGKKGKNEGTTSGRTAGSNPNIQNQPNPLKAESDKFLVELGSRWRRIYRADPGKFWAMADLAQQEPKWTVRYALYRGFKGAKEAAARWKADPKLKLAKLVGEMTGLDYGMAKIWFLARCYGAGKGNLCGQLGLPTVPMYNRRTGELMVDNRGEPLKTAGPEGDAIIRQCDALVPYVPELLEDCKAQVQKNGYICLRLLDGRRFRFEKLNAVDYHRIHKALNTLAQGSAAIQLKMILLALARAGIPAHTTVHDDVSRSCETMAEAQEMRRIVESVLHEPEVPWYAKLLCGPTFGDACLAEDTPLAA